jgi:uncharacterized membrane-anchored protein
MSKVIAVLGLLLVLGLINLAIYQKEQHLSHGEVVRLKLAPVDPRSLMQGDYMALRFELAEQIYDVLPKKTATNTFWQGGVEDADGWVIVQLDEFATASFVALDTCQALDEKQRKLQFRARKGQIKFATNAFFFEEGTAALYDAAVYGEFRVNQQGEVLLSALLDKDLQVLGQ